MSNQKTQNAYNSKIFASFLGNLNNLLYLCTKKRRKDVMDDKTPNYGAIIVEKTHPDLELILARFDELAAFLKKPIV